MKSKNIDLINKSVGRTLIGLFILFVIISIQALLGCLVLYVCITRIGNINLEPYTESGQTDKYRVHAELKNGWFPAFGAMFAFVLWCIFGLKLHVISLAALKLLAGDELRDTIKNE